MKINEILKNLRQRKKKTQSEIADELDVSLSSYQKYEREKNPVIPSLEVLIRISDFYGESMDYLLGRDSRPQIEYLTESEKDLESCILEKYKQLPESYRKKFLQGVMEAVEIQRREQTSQQADTISQEETTQPTMQEQGSREEQSPVEVTTTTTETNMKPKAAARQGEVPHLEDDEYWAKVDKCSPVKSPHESP